MANVKQTDILTGSIPRQLLAFFLPIWFGTLFQQLYNTADTLIVGNFVGTQALAAVGATGAFVNLLVGLFVGLCSGVGVVVSQSFGARDYDGVDRQVHTALVFSVVIGALLTVLGVIAVLEMYFLISLGVDHMEHVVIAAVLMMFATYGAAVYVFVRGVASYASELKAKSAYLIFMTPNSGLKSMGSKYLYTFVNGILLGGVCGALGALDLSLIMTHEDDWQSFLRMMDIFLRVNQGVQTGQIVLAIVFYLVLVLLSLLTFFAMAYFAITLSHTLFRDKKWRTWVALLIFIGVYWGLSYLQGLLPNPVENLVFNTMYDPNAEITVTTFADMIPQMLPYALYDLAIVLLSLFGCGWMLDKKVSL